MSTEQQEEDDFHLEEVRGSHSTKVLMMVAGIILFESMGHHIRSTGKRK